MDFIKDAQIIIPVLSRLNMTVYENEKKDILDDFERRSCFMPDMQPLYTADGLLDFFSKRGADKIYAVTDGLGVHCVILAAGSKWIILGPFVVSTWRASEAKRVLSHIGAKDNTFLPFQNYYCSLPMIADEYAIRIATVILDNTIDNPPQEVEYLDFGGQQPEDISTKIYESYDELSVVEHRYRLEEQLMDAVRQGQTAQALRIFSDICAWSRGLKFYSDGMKDQIAGVCIIRTLVRHAALQSGLAPVLVDALSQEYAQKMHVMTDSEQLTELTRQYIAAFCAAVRENRKKGKSPQVRRAIQYIEVHLSDPLSVDGLCAAVGVSRQGFVRLFKIETGLTIKQYIAKARCERAKELLINKQILIHDIAGYVGYEDTNYFTRIFKSVIGISPQKYREKYTFK